MGKKYDEAVKKIDRLKEYSVEEAIALLKEISFVKFDQSLDIALNLGVDPRKSDQMVRGFVVLPHGTGKTVRVLVFAKGEKEKEARDAGADFVGAEDMIEKIQKGWLDFDKAVATPDLMGAVGKLGKLLGPRGLMPNPKTGTVTFDITRAVKEIKAGKVDYRVEKGGIVHMPVGKLSFKPESIADNVKTALDSIIKAKPSTSRGRYLRRLVISSTMGPGLKIDLGSVTASKI
ncbi:50S ribosomal protein L1 [Candidatus Magnetominusculus dajiuhuensis]|uniref:50S ribosomal protein L1 n=1 Tax=Candidatus Magnetominusculus dajiuhuensis TaxID=3137712 RepID=UPI003B43B683